jgi:deoxyribonuclease-2
VNSLMERLSISRRFLHLAIRMGLVRWIFVAAVTTAVGALQCKSDSGDSVDWWVAVKEPRGTGYFYGDSQSAGTFARSLHSMNDTRVGALSSTVPQIWSAAAAAAPAYILWNDEPPASTGYNFSYGHTKAILTVDGENGGFWLTHSIPLYPAGPALTPHYTGLGSNAWRYAQSAACFSLTTSEIATLAHTLQLDHPQIYDTGGEIAAAPASFQELAAGMWRPDATCEQTEIGAYSVFSKTPTWNADLWAECVAPALKSDLWVESWIRGSEEGPACSATWHTLDVQSLTWGWSEPDDHSKWAVAPNGSAPFLCIGDINRMTTQYARAGGAICWQSPLSQTFISAISGSDTC